MLFHGRIQREDRGSGPRPWKTTQLQGFLAIPVQVPWKIAKLPSQHSMLGHHRPASETPSKCFMGGSRGRDRGSGPPPPGKPYSYRVLSNTGPDPLKKSQSYQASIQCWLNGVSLAGRWWPSFSAHWIQLKTKKNIVRVQTSDKTFWIRACVLSSRARGLNFGLGLSLLYPGVSVYF